VSSGIRRESVSSGIRRESVSSDIRRESVSSGIRRESVSSGIRQLIRRNAHRQSEVHIFVIAYSVIFKTALVVHLKYVFVFKPNCFPSINARCKI